MSSPGEDFLPQDATWPKRPLTARKWIWFLVGGVIGLGLALGKVSLPDIPFRVQFQIVSGFFLSVVAHETGHLIGGLLVGFRTVTFAVWPCQISRQGGSWRLGWIRSTGVAGFVSLDPRTTQHSTFRLGIVTAAGPSASALVGIAAGLYLDGGFVAFWSLLFAIIGFLPIKSLHAVNDGWRLRMLCCGGTEAERFRALIQITASSNSGTPPRDLPPALMESLGTADDESPDGRLAQLFRFNWLLDSGRVEEAGPVLAAILSRPMPEPSRATWWLEAAWVEARYRRDIVAAHRWYDPVPTRYRAGVNRCSALKAQAAIAFLEQRWADADAAIEEALKSCDISDLGVAIATREDLVRLRFDVASERANSTDKRTPLKGRILEECP